jgi:SRSO17 transposase
LEEGIVAEEAREQGIDELMEAQAWLSGLETLHARISRHFARPEVRETSLGYVKGLLGPVERKNGWQLAEQARDSTPDGMQRLLAKAQWDADKVRDDVRDYIVEHLQDSQAVLVVDETGFLKKGTKSVGVKRQYSGTAGKIDNCQVGVFLAYASPKGRTFIDRELYLPKEWAEDTERRKEAGVPESVDFATKIQLAREMLNRAFTAGITANWVTADEVYGSDTAFRRKLEERRQGYVVETRSNVGLWEVKDGAVGRVTVAERVARLPEDAWVQVSAGDGAKGPRLYDWACELVKRQGLDGWGLWVLARRNISKPTEMAYYYVFGPDGTTLREMVRVAGMRWMIEESLETAKGEVGLDQYEVRRWNSWYRHITLAMLAHAFLTVTRLHAVTTSAEKGAA